MISIVICLFVHLLDFSIFFESVDSSGARVESTCCDNDAHHILMF